MATHGSLTKAGKVRGQTPKVEGRKIVGTNSKLRNKSNFKKRFVLTKKTGRLKDPSPNVETLGIGRHDASGPSKYRERRATEW